MVVMSQESFNSLEDFGALEGMVVEALSANGVDHEPTKILLQKYVDRVHAEVDQEVKSNPDDLDLPNRANIKAEIKIAKVCLDSAREKARGISALEEALLMAGQSVKTEDLAEQILVILDNL